MVDKPNDIEAIYNAALDKVSEAQRAAYLDAACGNDSALRARVEALLKAHDQAGSFLDEPALDAGATLEESPLIEGPGTRIGHYELLELIGEGGMGLVYLAEQKKPVRRRVALKIMKPGMDSRQVIARFEAERQALALLDHPNIARVIDAGTTKTGRPYFAMEYVKGVSIIKHCDEQKLSIEKRLELFRQVCEGVEHAHQKGIIHRDIKPSNILVSNHGDKAVPKIIDFGIAKAITQPLTEETFFTQQGQLLGTPEYMSPEQVDLATQDIDTRSDVYSLGVLLYVLLAGTLPFDRESLEKAGFAEIQRTIREEEPPLPSTRLTNLGKEAKVIAENRRTHIITLTRRLHRELEWIPMKAMRKERTRRYRSASELADDIQNYLTGTPLIAGPESAVYRARKFVRKHAGSVATAALVAVVIVLGLVASILMGCRAEQARKKEASARTQAEQAEKVADKQRELAEEQRKIAEEQAEKYRKLSYIHSVALADAKYRERNLRSARKLLKSCPEDLRNWEWYRLNHIMDESLITLAPSQIGIFSFAVSPNGNRIASGSMRNDPITIWDAQSGTEVLNFKVQEKKAAWSLGFSPDGKRLVSGGSDHKVTVWDASNGNEIMTLAGHQGRVSCVAVSPDGERIVSGSFDHTLKIWDASTGQELRTFSEHENIVICAAFSPNGREIASGGYDQTVRIWDTVTGEQLKSFRMDDQKVITVDYSPDGKRIVSGSFATTKLWDTDTGAELMTISTDHAIYALAFSPDGRTIAAGAHDELKESIILWKSGPRAAIGSSD